MTPEEADGSHMGVLCCLRKHTEETGSQSFTYLSEHYCGAWILLFFTLRLVWEERSSMDKRSLPKMDGVLSVGIQLRAQGRPEPEQLVAED